MQSNELSLNDYIKMMELSTESFTCIGPDNSKNEHKFSVLTGWKRHKMIIDKNHSFLKDPMGFERLKQFAVKNQKFIIKHCDYDIIKYFFPDSTDHKFIKLLIKYSKIGCIKKFSEENKLFLKELLVVTMFGNIDNVELFEFLYDHGQTINEMHATYALLSNNLDAVKWVFSKISTKDYESVIKELQKKKICPEHEDIISWLRENNIYSNHKFDIPPEFNSSLFKIVDSSLVTDYMLIYCALMNDFETMKRYDLNKLNKKTIAYILYYACIHNNKDVFETRITNFLTFTETQLLIDVGGLDAVIEICDLAIDHVTYLSTSIYYGGKSSKFMNKYLDEIVKKCSFIKDMNSIQIFFLDMNNKLKFHKAGKVDLFYELCDDRSCFFIQWENIDYVFSSGDQKLIDAVATSSRIISYPKYKLQEHAYIAIKNAFPEEDILVTLLNLSIPAGQFEIINDLLNMGVKFNEYSLNYAFSGGIPLVEWLLESGSYNFPVTHESIDKYILSSPQLKDIMLKWATENIVV